MEHTRTHLLEPAARRDPVLTRMIGDPYATVDRILGHPPGKQRADLIANNDGGYDTLDRRARIARQGANATTVVSFTAPGETRWSARFNDGTPDHVIAFAFQAAQEQP